MELGSDLSDASDLSDLSDTDFFWWGNENKALRLFGELQGFLFEGVLLLFGKGKLDCFFVEHCASGFGFVCVGFVFAVEADALVDDVEFYVFDCCVRYVAYTCGG